MNYEFFIAKRLYCSNTIEKQVSRPAIRIAVAGISIGLAIMILAVFVVIGFKKEVRDKITGFSSHVQITNFSATDSYETYPIYADKKLMDILYKIPHVKHVERYSTKPGMLKTSDNFQGIVLKGIGQEYDTSFLQKHLLEGKIPQFNDSTSSNKVLISKLISKKLNLKLGDKITCYFINTDVRARRLQIAGIYSTNLTYDKIFLITDINLVHHLNDWEKGQVGGIAVQVDDFDRMSAVTYMIAKLINNHVDKYGDTYFAQSVEQRYPELFSWLNLLDVNVWMILILMIGVAGFTMISGLLIIILERTNMIGILKALGSKNKSIRHIFLYMSIFLIGKGMIIGNILALFISFVQLHWGLFKLDAETYYLDRIPIKIDWVLWSLLNISTFIIATLILIGPSFLIAKIKPSESMRFE